MLRFGVSFLSVVFSFCVFQLGHINQQAYAAAAQEPGCYIDKFKQPAVRPVDKVDVLFVMDTSYSLENKRAKVIQGIENLVASFPQKTDYQIGVVMAHGYDSSAGGKLVKAGSEPAVLSNQSLTLSQIQTHLASKFKSFFNHRNSAGGEVGLSALYFMVTPRYLPDNKAAGFFREDAALAVIFMSDENDICAKYPAGVTRRPDPDSLEAPAYKKYCAPYGEPALITPEFVNQYVRDRLSNPKQPKLRLSVGAIVYNDAKKVPAPPRDPYALGYQDEYGWGYMELVSLAKGISVDISSGDYSKGLGDFGGLVGKELDFQKDFILSHADVDATTIVVKVDGVDQPFTYNSAKNEVHVENSGKENSEIEISYCQKGWKKPAPTIISIIPDHGPVTGGTHVTIAGTNFQAGVTVSLGGAVCSNLALTGDSSIQCDTSAHAAGKVNVVVSNPDQQSVTLPLAYTYDDLPPVVTSITPNSGSESGGTSVRIVGDHFLAGANVTLGGALCSPVVLVSEHEITCTTSAHVPGVVDLIVTNPDQQSVTGAGLYTYLQDPPKVFSVNPSSGVVSGGTLVTIAGIKFQVGATVSFDNVPCTGVSVLSATSIQCTTSAHSAGLVDVTVTNPDQKFGVGAKLYTYVEKAPVAMSIVPNHGPLTGGTVVVINGVDFLPGVNVTLGGSPCLNIQLINSSQIQCTTPPYAVGKVDVVITNYDGQNSTLVKAYTYENLPPSVLAVTPNSGTQSGGTLVHVSGDHFLPGASVSLGGVACTSLTFVSVQELTCITGVHAPGVVDLIVTNPDQQSVVGAGLYTYLKDSPKVFSVTPNQGFVTGGELVVITGQLFEPGVNVTFGGVNCINVTFISSTQIVCNTPPHAVGVVDVRVTNSDGLFGEAKNSYTYKNHPPSVLSIAPVEGSTNGGTVVTISGHFFLPGVSVDLGGSACTNVNVSADGNTITCTTGAHAAGFVDVNVVNPDAQSGKLPGGYRYKESSGGPIGV